MRGVFLAKPEIRPRWGSDPGMDVLLGSLNHYAKGLFARDGNFTRGFGYPRISDPPVSGSGTKFNLRVSPIPDP
jgi:hypothetical protein